LSQSYGGGILSVVVDALGIPEVALIRLKKFGDDRGFFSETYSKPDFAEAGLHVEFVQDNHSLSTNKGTLRGLHFQIPPFEQAKLVRVTRGAIFDVAVDLRCGSPTYGRHVSAVIGAESWNQIFVPVGFAHGFLTLEPNTEVLYKVSNVYSAEHDKGVLWNDPTLEIDWPVSAADAILSDKDRSQPMFSHLPTYFRHELGEVK
jgi:dTDP-4-dehydrorhamnose 3,5-epimerase